MTTTKFNDLCASLHRNDPELKEIALSFFRDPQSSVPRGYGRLLGNALQQSNNTHLCRLYLDIENLLAASRLREYDYQDIKHEIHSLLEFISNSTTSLSKITLRYRYFPRNMNSSTQKLANLLLSAVVCNPCITDVILCVKFFSTVEFVRCLTSSTHNNIKSLSIRFLGCSTEEDDADLISSALGNMSKLENLLLFRRNGTPSTKILLQLCQHVKTQNIKVLSIACDDNPGSRTPNCLMTLVDFMENTSSLQVLTLQDFSFVGMRFVKAMTNCQSITSLSLDKCTFDSTATQGFVTLMQSNHMQQLRQLCIEWCKFRSSQQLSAQPTAEAKILIGSHIDEYSVKFCQESGESFFRDLRDNASFIRVRHLIFHRDWRIDFKSFSKFWVTSTSIQELRVKALLPATVRPIQVVSILRKNGSLRNLLDPGESYAGDFTHSLFKEPLLHRVRAIEKRNECLPKLLSSPATNGSCTTTITADVSLFPTLFAAAKQAPRMAPNHLLMGLSAAGAHLIGPV